MSWVRIPLLVTFALFSYFLVHFFSTGTDVFSTGKGVFSIGNAVLITA